MEHIQTALLRVLRQMRLSDEQHQAIGDAILSAGSRAELGVLVAELQDLAGDDLDALAGGFQQHGNATEAARIRAEARLAHAPMDALLAQATETETA